ncbi:TenA family transcriptional regulator [Rickettsia endosymbiont of Halotydeus destructor]|uniref:TenA family transcriptional regulator n=1 Tax=Rickettsia endosymbiont of Halotydeus destructor TaxID=2996754 RepID=UPI003BB0B075
MQTLINQILQDLDYKNNPYFTTLHDGTFSKEDFIETQIQFYFAVVFFNRPMSALAAKIPVPELRLEILRNIWEEHGEGNLSKAHGKSFLDFLAVIGNITNEEIIKKTLWPEVRAFNTCLSGTCVLDDFMVGTAMMGIIERMFCTISTILATGIIERGWVEENALLHYNVHSELDIKHSEDFFHILAKPWEKNDENKYFFEQGLRLGSSIFNNLYKELYTQRARRLTRKWYGRHSRAEGVS